MICAVWMSVHSTVIHAQEDTSDRSLKVGTKKVSKDKQRKKSKKRKSGFFFGHSGMGMRWDKGANEVRLSGLMQLDSRTYFDDTTDSGQDNFILRRIQPSLEVKLGKIHSFYIMPSFASNPGILDVYVESQLSKPFNVRVGKFKSPFGLERLQSATALAFNERAFPTSLAPNREIGAQVFGDILWDTTQYQVGLFSGAVDNSAGLRDHVISSNHSGIDFVGRVFSYPLRNSQLEFMQGLGLGVAYSYGTQHGNAQADGANLPTFRSPGQQIIASYVDGAFADGSRQRISPQLYYHHGSLGVLGEYVFSQQDIKLGNDTDKVSNEAFQIQLSWVIFNGDASFRRVRPRDPLAMDDISTWGAVQLVTRYSELNLDSNAFAHGLVNPDHSVKKAQDFGVGVNWYLNRNVKLQLNYHQTHFNKGVDGGADRPDEKILFSRMQVAF